MTCGLCRVPLDDAPVVSRMSRFGHACRRVACAACGLVQVSPQPDPGELADYYASHDYRREYGPATLIVSGPSGARRVGPGEPGYNDALNRKAKIEARAIDRARPVDGLRVLEIGCGEGRMLAALRDLGADVTGVEPDADAAEVARRRLGAGATVHAATLEAAPLDPPYDVVTSWHVLEHAADPVGMLRAMRILMDDDGMAVLEVPNVGSPNIPLDADHFQHVHLFDFELYTLVAVLCAAGLDPAKAEMSARAGAGSWLRVAAVKGEPGTADTGTTGAEVAAYLAGIRWATGEDAA